MTDNQKLTNALFDVLDNHQHMPPYEVGILMITLATHLLLDCAPTELVGVKTALAGVDQGIKMREEYQARGQGNMWESDPEEQ